MYENKLFIFRKISLSNYKVYVKNNIKTLYITIDSSNKDLIDFLNELDEYIKKSYIENNESVYCPLIKNNIFKIKLNESIDFFNNVDTCMKSISLEKFDWLIDNDIALNLNFKISQIYYHDRYYGCELIFNKIMITKQKMTT
jgi:hypothetical protein